MIGVRLFLGRALIAAGERMMQPRRKMAAHGCDAHTHTITGNTDRTLGHYMRGAR